MGKPLFCLFLFQVGNTALMYAAHSDHPHCVNELLLRGADFTATNESGDTAYTIVVRNNSHLGKRYGSQQVFVV